jgi:hypothetical protein
MHLEATHERSESFGFGGCLPSQGVIRLGLAGALPIGLRGNMIAVSKFNHPSQ